MVPTMLAEVRFDDSSRTSHSDQPVPAGGVLRALRNAAEMSGLDPVAELYNEALRCATEGHLRMARERLQVLLGLAPDDGEARLLLAKIHVAGQRWQEALAALDEAESCGVHVPMELRRAVEDHLRADRLAEDEQLEAHRAREQGEIKALRQEARRLRSENAQLLGRCHDLERETRKWAWTTAAVSVVGMVFIAATLVLGGPSGDGEAAEVATADVAATEAAATDVAAGDAAATPSAPPTTSEIAERASAALAGAAELDDTRLAVQVGNGNAIVTGEVVTARQRIVAERTLKGVSGIRGVDTSGVTVLARTKGAEHTVRKGDTLGKIALHYYGEANLAKQIQDANHGLLKGKTDLQIGMKLKVPPVR